MKDLLLRAAEIIETHAHVLFCTTTTPNGKFDDKEIEKEYVEMLRVAGELRARHAEEAREKKMKSELAVQVDGRMWSPYIVEYTTADGVFTTKIFAVSMEHAAAVVEELKDTAVLKGELMKEIKV